MLQWNITVGKKKILRNKLNINFLLKQVDPVLCEDVIRIEHALTKRNMHTHDIKAPLSGKQEVGDYNISFEKFVKDNSFFI